MFFYGLVLSLLEKGKYIYGKMLLNILITLFLLGLCLGEKKTLSSIRFHRYDVPLPYKYSSLRDYSIEKSRKHNHQTIDYFRTSPNILKSIQYAPLNPEDETFPNDHDIKNLKNKVHLEPKVIEKSENHSQVSQANFLKYIEGHNIVPLKRFKDDGYHDIYSEKNKQIDQIDYDVSLSKLKQEIVVPQRDVTLKAVTTKSAHIDFNNQETFPRNMNPTKSYLSALENSQIEPVFNSYVKVPRLHLNIARAYNFARLPLKASLMGYQKFIINNPKQAFVPNIDLTFLYPVDNNKYALRT